MIFEEFDPVNKNELELVKKEISQKLRPIISDLIYELAELDELSNAMENSGFEVIIEGKEEIINRLIAPIYEKYENFYEENKDIVNPPGSYNSDLYYIDYPLKSVINCNDKENKFNDNVTMIYKQKESYILISFLSHENDPAMGIIQILQLENNIYKYKEIDFVIGNKLLSDEIKSFTNLYDNFEDKDDFIESYITNIQKQIKTQRKIHLYIRSYEDNKVYNSKRIYEEFNSLNDIQDKNCIFDFVLIKKGKWGDLI